MWVSLHPSATELTACVHAVKGVEGLDTAMRPPGMPHGKVEEATSADPRRNGSCSARLNTASARETTSGPRRLRDL